MASSSNGKRDYKYSIKLYPDCKDFDAKKCVKKLCGFFEQYAYIVHDRDKKESQVFEKSHLRIVRRPSVITGDFIAVKRMYNPYVKPHIHFYGKNNVHCKISALQIVKFLGIPHEYAERPNEIAPASDWLACLLYTVHRNAPDKFQYDVSDVITNIPRFEERLKTAHSMSEDLKILFQLLDEAETMGVTIPYYELVREMTKRNCTLQFSRPSMVEKISASFQYNRMGRVVQ